MNEREARFTPEAIEKQTVHGSAELASEETRLVQHIYALSQSYAQKNEQSLERIWNRLQQSQEQAVLPQGKQLFLEGTMMNKNDTIQRTEMSRISAQGTILSTPAARPPRKFRRIFTLAVAILVAVLLIGTMLAIVTNTYQPGGIATASQHTPTPKLKPVLISGKPFPAQDCPSPYNDSVTSANWSPWYQLCKAGMFVTVNQSRPLTHLYSETILAAYADQNSLLLIYDLSPLKATDVVNIQNTPITKQGTQLQQLGGMQGFNRNQHFYWLFSYDTSNLPVSLQTLTVKINSRVGLPGGGASLKKTDFPYFSIPLHSAKMLTPKQAVTANHIPITLSKVIIGATGVHIIFAASHIPDAALSSGFQGLLQSGKISVSSDLYRLLTTTGSVGMVATGFTFAFDSNLTASHGAWTLTVTATGEPQPWIFHFTVPA